MFKLFFPLIIGILVLGIFESSQSAFAVTVTLTPDAAGEITCNSLGGTWDGGFFICSFLFFLTWGDSPAEEVLTIKPGATLDVFGGGAILKNLETINNEGTTKVSGGGAKLDTSGKYNNEGTTEVKGAGSKLDNSGDLTNSGTITVSGGGAMIINSGTILNFATISVSGAEAIFQNYGTILNCGGQINGPIIGNPPIDITDECGKVVEIDIKPNSDPNCFNNNGHGVIPVAILGSDSFDATLVDPTTVKLNDSSVKLKRNGDPQANIEDVNGDGFEDLVVKIQDVAETYPKGDSTATLRAETFTGTIIIGTDNICNTQ